MKVKIGTRWHEPRRGRPIMLVLSDEDKKGMAPMFSPMRRARYAIFVHGDPLFADESERAGWRNDLPNFSD